MPTEYGDNKILFDSGLRVTQEFGVNKSYYSKWGLQGHEGLDVTPLNHLKNIKKERRFKSLPYRGVVVKDIDMASKGGNYGNTFTLWYPEIKEAWQYCHNSENEVSMGQEIAPSSYIGYMGGTGNTNGDHVHINRFKVDARGYRINKQNGFLGGIDPLPFLLLSSSIPNNSVPSTNNPMPENPSKLLAHMGVKTEQEGIEVWDRETAFLKDEREKVERLKIDLEVEEKATNIARENHQKDLDMLAKLLNSQAGIEAIEKEVRHLLSVEEEKRQLQVKYDREIIEHKKTYEESQRELEKLRSENERLREQNKIDREEFEKKLENQQLQIDNAIKKSNEAKEKLESAQNEVFEGLYAWLKSIFKRK